jgi:hypothetical protein
LRIILGGFIAFSADKALSGRSTCDAPDVQGEALPRRQKTGLAPTIVANPMAQIKLSVGALMRSDSHTVYCIYRSRNRNRATRPTQ